MGRDRLSVRVAKPEHVCDPGLERMWETPGMEEFLDFYFNRYVPIKAWAVALTAQLPEDVLWREFTLFDDLIDLGDTSGRELELVILNTSWNDLLLAALFCHQVALDVRRKRLKKFLGYNPLKIEHWGSEYLSNLRKLRGLNKKYRRWKRDVRQLRKAYPKDREHDDLDRLPIELLERIEAVRKDTEEMLQNIRPSAKSRAGAFMWKAMGVVFKGGLVFLLAKMAITFWVWTGGS
jgi:hypothetical protein